MSIVSDVIIAIGFALMLTYADIYFEILARFIIGFGIGIQIFSISIFLKELVLPRHSRTIRIMKVTSMGIGMLLGLNLCIPLAHHWKILFALGFIPLVMNFIALLLLPESPMYYIFIKKDGKALEVLKKCLKEEDAMKYL